MPGLPARHLAWAFLALGHFAEGSDPGLPTALPWANGNVPGRVCRLHPIALYAALVAVILTVVLFLHLRRRRRRGETAAFGVRRVWACASFCSPFSASPTMDDRAVGQYSRSYSVGCPRHDRCCRTDLAATTKAGVAMPSKNMLPKGQRRHSVKAEYRATRGVEADCAAASPRARDRRRSRRRHPHLHCRRREPRGCGSTNIWRRPSPTSAARGCSC